MTSEEFKPKRGRPPKNAPKTVEESKSSDNKVADLDKLAKERRERRKEVRSKTGQIPGQKLWAPQIDGYQHRWVVDAPGRIDYLQDEGYYFCEVGMHPDYEKVSAIDPGKKKMSVVVTYKGEHTRQYLMRRPIEIAEEAQAEKMERLRRRDEGLVLVDNNQGIGRTQNSSGKSVMYDPTGGNSVFKT